MDDHGYLEGDKCKRNGCTGVMKVIEQDGCCSCHINPPCSYCVDMCYQCPECGYETEPPEPTTYKSNQVKQPEWKSYEQRFLELKEGEFNYVTIPGKYYWMEYKGRYPEGMGFKDILSSFNTCFGYKWLRIPEKGVFHLKVYTD